jgi:predicted dehydrogenase
MSRSNHPSRREFIDSSAKTAATLAAVGAVTNSFAQGKTKLNQKGANDRINVAVVGIRSRGMNHCEEWTKIPGVQVHTLCDVDENLFAERVARVEKMQGVAPKTEVDIRRLLENKDIDAISIATTNHWHALASIWGVMAGKHVYNEKPTSHNIWEGRKIVEAARRYNRIVAAGMQNRSIKGVIEAIKFLHEGGLGDLYMAKGLCFKPRDTIGKKLDGPVPEGVHYDMWLGPAPVRPFNPNRFHYNWHWCWDYGCADFGNQGPHQLDIARWGLNKREHPKKIKCVGGHYAFDDDQETPNQQFGTFEYNDGKIMQFEVRGLYTNNESNVTIGNLFYGSKGWMALDGPNWKTYFGRKNEPGPSYDANESAADPMDLAGAGSSAHFANFIAALRANDVMKLNADIEDGHMSSSLAHLANISYRLGRELTFDSHAEQFENDPVANSYLTRDYRYPYVIPEKF